MLYEILHNWLTYYPVSTVIFSLVPVGILWMFVLRFGGRFHRSTRMWIFVLTIFLQGLWFSFAVLEISANEMGAAYTAAQLLGFAFVVTVIMAVISPMSPRKR